MSNAEADSIKKKINAEANEIRTRNLLHMNPVHFDKPYVATRDPIRHSTTISQI